MSDPEEAAFRSDIRQVLTSWDDGQGKFSAPDKDGRAISISKARRVKIEFVTSEERELFIEDKKFCIISELDTEIWE